jgi:GT2 family glycosyltransferase
VEKIRKRETIAANVVTYNRKKLLIECLDALLKQTYPLNAIYIIDNASTDGTPRLLKEKGYIKDLPLIDLDKPIEKIYSINMLSKGNEDKVVEIHYVRMNENTGSSGGQYEGVKRGYEKGYDWLWLMDDDGKPLEDCLHHLLSCFNSKKVDVISPISIESGFDEIFSFIITNYKGKKFRNENVRHIKSVFPDFFPYGTKAFLGSLIPFYVIKKIGFPDKDLFIWGDEYDYVFRIKKYFSFGIATKAVFKHPMGKNKYRKIFGGIFGHIIIAEDNKKYYYFRNMFYVKLKYVSKYNALKFICIEVIKHFFYIIQTLDLKEIKNILLLSKAFKDGFIYKKYKKI